MEASSIKQPKPDGLVDLDSLLNNLADEAAKASSVEQSKVYGAPNDLADHNAKFLSMNQSNPNEVIDPSLHNSLADRSARASDQPMYHAVPEYGSANHLANQVAKASNMSHLTPFELGGFSFVDNPDNQTVGALSMGRPKPYEVDNPSFPNSLANQDVTAFNMDLPKPHELVDSPRADQSPAAAHTPFSTTSDCLSGRASVPFPSTEPRSREPSTATVTDIPTKHVSTKLAYLAWAPVYDTDGNVLQALDDHTLGMKGGLMTTFVNGVSQHVLQSRFPTVEIIDLGCGTGRSILTTLKYNWPVPHHIHVTGIDSCPPMLARAAEKVKAWYLTAPAPMRGKRGCDLFEHDFLNPIDENRDPILVDRWDYKLPAQPAGLISTLVLEHFPVEPFFAVVASLLRPGDYVLLTNMHKDMGARTQAGFTWTDPQSGQATKIRGKSWVHSIPDVVEAGQKWGFQKVDSALAGVDEGMIEAGVVGERGRKWIGVTMWFGLVLRKGR